MRSSWRGRSRMTTVMSLTLRPSASAMRPRFSVGLTRMSTWPAATGPTHSFSRYVSGAWIRPPASDAARTVIAPAWPWATRFVPSSGSTAMSTRGHVVAVGAGAPDPLADVEHRGLVALALADDDPAREVDLVHRRAHGLGGGGVRLVLRAATHEPGGFDRRGLRDPDHLEREQLFHQVAVSLAQGAASTSSASVRGSAGRRRVKPWRGGAGRRPRWPSRRGSSRPAG